MSIGKSLGLDGVSPEIIKAIIDERPKIILEVMNKYLKGGDFPDVCKVTRLVFLRKGKPEVIQAHISSKQYWKIT